MEPVKVARKVTAAVKKRVAGKQRFTCATNVSDYTCPLGGNPFDEAGYEIDHIVELCNGGTNDESNLQALCLMCHRVKSNRNSTKQKKALVEKVKVDNPTLITTEKSVLDKKPLLPITVATPIEKPRPIMPKDIIGGKTILRKIRCQNGRMLLMFSDGTSTFE